MAYLIGIGLLVLGLLISIALHEVGHMLPAKKFGVKVPQYFVGFGPTLFSVKRGETEYGVKAIPLGGYVRLAGMYPPASALASPPKKTRSMASAARDEALEGLDPGEEHRAFYRLSTPKKVIVMMAGPVMNLVIAFVLLTGIMMGWGLPVPSPTLADVPACATASEPCSAPGAAYVAGLRAGDTITSYAGEPITSWQELTDAVARHGTAPTQIGYLSDGVAHTATITPQTRVVGTGDGASEQRVVISVIAGQERRPAAFGDVFAMTGTAVADTFKVIGALPIRLYDVARSLVTDEPREDGVMSIIGVGRIAGEVAATPADAGSAGGNGPGWTDKIMSLLSLIASLNIALFAFNLIPLLPLDGGHIAGALYEGGRRQVARMTGRPDPGPVDTARLLPLTYAVFVVLIAMTLLLSYADIVKPISF